MEKNPGQMVELQWMLLGAPPAPRPPQSILMMFDTHNPTGRYLFPSVSSRGCDYMSPIVWMGKLRHAWSGVGRGVQPGSPELGCKLGPAWGLEVGRVGSGSTEPEAGLAGELKGDPRAGRGAAQIHTEPCEAWAAGSRQ